MARAGVEWRHAVLAASCSHTGRPGRRTREPVFFCQREAAETAIFLAEVAGRHGAPITGPGSAEQNALHNDGLPRVALKMATGTGKTVVMAMLIAWNVINKVMRPGMSDSRSGSSS